MMAENRESNFNKHESARWCPVYTLYKNEKKIYDLLKGCGVEAYLPMREHVNIQPVVSKGKSYCYKRKILVPMFSCYLFACLSYDNYSVLQKNRSVVRVLQVTPYEEELLIKELRVIQTLERISKEQEIDVMNGIVAGSHVRFTEGKFAGWEGVALGDIQKTGFVYINIASVFANVRIQYPVAWCEIIKENPGK